MSVKWQHGSVMIEAVILTSLLTMFFLWIVGIGQWAKNQLIAIDIATVGGEMAYRDCSFRFTDDDINDCFVSLHTKLQNYATSVFNRQAEVIITRFEGSAGTPSKAFSTADVTAPTLGSGRITTSSILNNQNLLQLYTVDLRLISVEVFIAGGSAWGVAYEVSVN